MMLFILFSIIDSLEESSISISGFGGAVFDGVADSSGYTPQNLDPIDPNGTTLLNFEISLTDKSIVEQLFDKQVFTVILTPKQYFTPDPETNLNYHVCIWGFGQDECGTGGKDTAAITFGPAIGADNTCLEVNKSGSHSAGKHCIHNDS